MRFENEELFLLKKQNIQLNIKKAKKYSLYNK